MPEDPMRAINAQSTVRLSAFPWADLGTRDTLCLPHPGANVVSSTTRLENPIEHF